MAIYIDFVTASYAAPGIKMAMLFFTAASRFARAQMVFLPQGHCTRKGRGKLSGQCLFQGTVFGRIPPLPIGLQEFDRSGGQQPAHLSSSSLDPGDGH